MLPSLKAFYVHFLDMLENCFYCNDFRKRSRVKILPQISSEQFFHSNINTDMKLKKFCNGTQGKMFLPHAVSGLASFTYNDSKDKSFSPEKIINNE